MLANMLIEKMPVGERLPDEWWEQRDEMRQKMRRGRVQRRKLLKRMKRAGRLLKNDRV